MAAIDFPPTPGDGQIFTAPNGNVYVFKAAPSPGLWVAQITTPGGSINQMRLYSEIILGAPATQLLPLVPPAAKLIELEWMLNVGAANKQIGLIYYRDGVAYAGSTYIAQKTFSGFASPATPGAAKVGPTTFWDMGTGTTHTGHLRFEITGDFVMANGLTLTMDNGGVIGQTSLAQWAGGLTGGVLTGFKFGTVDIANLLAGSWARVFAVW